TGYLVATTGSCASLTYNGSSRTLASGGTGVTYSNNTRTSAGSQTVTITANSGYRFSDGTTSKTLSCSIAKATPTLTLGSTAGTVVAGKTMTFTEKANIAGKFTNTSSSTSVATVSPTSNSTAVAANTNQTVTVTGVASGTSTITVTFTPTDTTNYNTITSSSTAKKTYTANVSKSAAIPTASSYCKTGLVYNGASQTLTNTAGTGYTFSGNTRTSAGSQTVTATLSSGYRWSDNTTAAKTFSCSIGQATPTVTLSASSGTVVAGNSITFTEKANVAGTFANSSGSTGVATISPASVTATANTAYTETIKGVAAGSSTITVKFTPTSTNYKSVTKTYTATVQTAIAKNEVNGVTTYYTTLKSALLASASGTTTLLANTAESISTNGVIINKTLNLNSKTKTGYIWLYDQSSTLVINGPGTLTDSVDRVVLNNGKMTINNVTINGKTNFNETILNKSTGILSINASTITSNSAKCSINNENPSTSSVKKVNTAISTASGMRLCGYVLSLFQHTEGFEVDMFGFNSTDNIKCPTWSTYNGQDDIEWPIAGYFTDYESTIGSYKFCRINKSNHNNETGNYSSHLYKYDSNWANGTIIGGFDYTLN
ncbi:MAG: GBS Bsp-like repeat-containing protein, partial [Bacilli bacterium]|nr:GBS Bsp-like repeat-containing protein [Bacilli bacterium]